MSQEVMEIYKELSELGIKENAYIELEQNYHQLKNEIDTDPSTEKFREVIEKIYRTFQVAMSNEKILVRVLKEMKKKTQEDAQQMNKIREQQKEDKKDMETVNRKLQELQKLQLIANQEKKDLIRFNEMSLPDKIKDDAAVDEAKIKELEKEKADFLIELTHYKASLEKSQNEMNELNQMKEKFETKIKELDINCKDLVQKLDNEIGMNKKKITEKDTEITQLKNFNSTQAKEIDLCKTINDDIKSKSMRQAEELSELRKKNDLLNSERYELEGKIKKYLEKIEDDSKEKKILFDRIKAGLETIKKLEKEKDLIEREISKRENQVKERNREVDKINKDSSERESIITRLENDISLKNSELESYKKVLEAEIKLKEKEILLNKKKEAEVRVKVDEILRLENDLLDLKGDIKNLNENLCRVKEDLMKASKLNSDIEKIRDKLTEENTRLKNKIDHLLEDMRLRDNRIQELQKKVAEAEKKMKMQREVYDTVRRDKNIYFKNLIETQDDLIDKQNLLAFNKKEIENLKSDLHKKDEYIVNLKSKNSSIEDILKTKQLETEKLKTELDQLKQMSSTQEKEIEKLKIEGLERSKDFKKVDSEYKKTIIDRDNISSQLIRRNDEVSLLHEKIMILTADISRSEREFQVTKELINKYVRDNRNLLRELEISKNYKTEAKTFAKEIINLNKELLREKNLVKYFINP